MPYVAKTIAAGTRFGAWTVLRRSDGDHYRGQRYDCRCDCGTVRSVMLRNLKDGSSRSCGCAPHERKHADLTVGHRVGWLTVIDGPHRQRCSGHLRDVYDCVCDCGNVVRVQVGFLRDQTTVSCGCLIAEVRKARVSDRALVAAKLKRTEADYITSPNGVLIGRVIERSDHRLVVRPVDQLEGRDMTDDLVYELSRRQPST